MLRNHLYNFWVDRGSYTKTEGKLNESFTSHMIQFLEWMPPSTQNYYNDSLKKAKFVMQDGFWLLCWQLNFNKHSESIALAIQVPYRPQQILKRHNSYKSKWKGPK